MTTDLGRAARRLGATANLAHGFVYFAPEAADAYRAVGLSDRQHYFASRAAPLGPVGPAVVEAAFFNFAPHRIGGALPSAWSVADPDTVQQARFEGVGAVFDRIGGIGLDLDERAEAESLLSGVIDGVDYGAKALAAANRALRRPADSRVALWQQVTVIREWRGDAHNAVLTTTPVTAVEALVLHAATGKVPVAALRDTRGWTDDQWMTAVRSLAARGLVDESGAFTDEGRAFRAAIETRTDTACTPLIDALGPESSDRLTALLRQMGAHFSQSGLYAAFTS